ncbi:MAG TPA: pyridoxamine 5'-phosphate oxidase family protein [Acidimicrobiales bacterium]|nr:pyridoxamine 5'-phosphate oxidase family protein [Acidimicrobiales bacterium]
MAEPIYTPTPRTTHRRKKARGTHGVSSVHDILDEGFVCHLGFVHDGSPYVFPTSYAREGDVLYLHGAAANFALRTLAAGAEVCVTVTLIDGLVLAKSAFHHSVNYRSVMVFGRAEAVTEPTEKARAAAAIVDHIVPGRSRDCRLPTDEELRATLIVKVPTSEASAKVRAGGPIDDAEDVELQHWSGVLPLRTVAEAPEDAPGYVQSWRVTR